MNPFNPREYFEKQKKSWEQSEELLRNHMAKIHEEKQEKEDFRFWLAVWISIIALAVSAISLWLQIRH